MFRFYGSGKTLNEKAIKMPDFFHSQPGYPVYFTP